MKLLLTSLAIALGVSVLVADSPNRRYARAVASPSGEYFMLVVPVDSNRNSWLWTVYRMSDEGAFKEVWSSDGAYATHIFLADDGESAACIESRPFGRTPQNDVVVAVFKRGKLQKSYRPLELVPSHEKIQFSVSHYRWLAERFVPVLTGPLVRLLTIDGEAWSVDIINGRLSREEK